MSVAGGSRHEPTEADSRFDPKPASVASVSNIDQLLKSLRASGSKLQFIFTLTSRRDAPSEGDGPARPLAGSSG
jgi:hypothetical protein